MKTKRANSGISFLRFVAALVVLLLGRVGGAFPQEKSAPKVLTQATATNLAEPEGAKAAVPHKEESRGGPSEGIKVHGHWTIEVRNRDGSVASHTEFENSLVPNGGVTLGSILSRTNVPARWALSVASSTSGGFCDSGTPGSPATCDLEESAVGCGQNGTAVCPPNVLPTLTVSFSSPNVVIQGTAVAAIDSNVGIVRSFVGVCQRGGLLINNPIVCTDDIGAVGNLGRTAFTSAALTTPITIVAGQTVSVTFTLSFS